MPRFQPPAYQARVVDLIHLVVRWMGEGAAPDALPPGVEMVVNGSSVGPLDEPRTSRRSTTTGEPDGPPTRVDFALFEVATEGGLLRVVASAAPSECEPDTGSGGWSEHADRSLADPRWRPTPPDGPLLQHVGGTSTPGSWEAYALQVRTDVATLTIGGTPVELPAHGVVVAIGRDEYLPVLGLLDADGATLWTGTLRDAVEVLHRTGRWPV